MINFVALDFETANRNRASACSIGAVKVKNGEVVDTFHSLINPPAGPSSFDPINISVHGIQPKDVKNAPDFSRVWMDFETWSEDLPFVAHNAAFDLSVVSQTLPIYGITPKSRDYFCSLIISRQVLDLVTYSLPFVVEELGIENFRHHDAVSDAHAAALVAIQLASVKDARTLEELANLVSVRPGKLSAEGASGSVKVRRGASRDYTNTQLEQIRAERDLSHVDTSNPFWSKKFVFTGTLSGLVRQEAQIEVLVRGGEVGSSVAKDTDFLVFGSQDARALRPEAEHSAKFEKAIKLREAGSSIEVVSEEVFLGWLETDYLS